MNNPIISWHISHLFYLRLLQCFSWAQMAMHADDQLRQRQSWALSQIIAVGLPGSGMIFYEVGNFSFVLSALSLFLAANSTISSMFCLKFQANEPYPSFYDQYVRNGFGSYRKLLKDMSFNIIMAEWLTFENNKSLQHNLNNGLHSHPDENYGELLSQKFNEQRTRCFTNITIASSFHRSTRNYAALLNWIIHAQHGRLEST